MRHYIIDRTKNPKGKSIPNTERFLNRVRSQIKTSVADMLKKAKIEEIMSGANNEIHVVGSILHEPHIFVDNHNSDWVAVLPGNPRHSEEDILINFKVPLLNTASQLIPYVEEDKIEKPSEGGGSGSKGSPDGSGMDDFIFQLDRKDWEKFLWDELELPNQDDRKSILVMPEWRKAGYASDGAPSNLALRRTAVNSYGRRIAFNRPKDEDIEALKKLIQESETEEEADFLEGKLLQMKSRMEIIPWIDPIDVRYYSYKKEMRPKFNAVMFCLMDVSGSMSDEMKDLAKRFYILLYSFLKVRYERVDIVFLRHHSTASEVDEQTFFYDPETGGTVVSTALELMNEIIKDRYPLADWNIYGAQCSDGDNYTSDNAQVWELMTKSILPIVQHFVYVEIARSWAGNSSSASDLWGLYSPLLERKEFDMAKIKEKSDIWPLMLRFYSKE